MKNSLHQSRLVADMARVARVPFPVAMACVGDYQGIGRSMVEIMQFVAERQGKCTASQKAQLLNGDMKAQRRAIMDVLGAQLWRQVQHSCGGNAHRIGILAEFLAEA